MISHEKLTVADLVIRRLAQHGVTQAFGVVGGAIMYLTDAIRRVPEIKTVFTHHEQAASIAAEAYGKLRNAPALVFATAGPGVTNAITGVVDAYMDSIPLILIVGDVRSSIAADFSRQRYNAPQEVNQAALLQPVVKHYLHLSPSMSEAEILSDIDNIFHCAVSNRPGPVCISIPLDVQGFVVSSKLLSTPLAEVALSFVSPEKEALRAGLECLKSSSRPLLLLGAGVRISNAVGEVDSFIHRHGLPWCVTIGAADLQSNTDPMSVGCVGPSAQRCANVIFKEADCILALGTSFDQSVTGFNVDDLLSNKKVLVVNVDSSEARRLDNPNVIFINTSVSGFLDLLNRSLSDFNVRDEWRTFTTSVKKLLSAETERAIRTPVRDGFISAYDVAYELSRYASPRATIVLGISLDAGAVFNSFAVTRGQRILVSRNLGPMGWDLPAAVGASSAVFENEDLIVVTGDGSFMLNIQELSVIRGLGTNACIFVFSNDGYVSIRTTQSNFFGPNVFGCDASSGLFMPSIGLLAQGFGFEYSVIKARSEILPVLNLHREVGVPRLVECCIDPRQLREPRLVSKVIDGKFVTPSLDDMTPPLPSELRQMLNYLSVQHGA
jgi:acetolactate synthase-1/2/3 large subunit